MFSDAHRRVRFITCDDVFGRRSTARATPHSWHRRGGMSVVYSLHCDELRRDADALAGQQLHDRLTLEKGAGPVLGCHAQALIKPGLVLRPLYGCLHACCFARGLEQPPARQPRTAARTAWHPPWSRCSPASCSCRPGRSWAPASSGRAGRGRGPAPPGTGSAGSSPPSARCWSAALRRETASSPVVMHEWLAAGVRQMLQML